MATRGTPLGFRLYLALLLAGLASLLVYTAQRSDFSHELWVGLCLTALLIVTEAADLRVRDKQAQLGLSAGEAILLPMIATLTLGQVVWGATIAMGAIGIVRSRGRVQKELFNFSMYGLVAGAAAGVYRLIAPTEGFTPTNALGLVAALVVSGALTHVVVSAAIALAEGESFIELTRAVGQVTLFNLVGNLVLGLFFTAALMAARWTVFLFPIPLVVLYWGLRAVLRQRGERQRLENLHAASRALAASTDMGESIIGFLSAVEEMVSASEALIVLDDGETRRWSAVRSNVVMANLEPLKEGPLISLMEDVRSDPSRRLFDDWTAAGSAGADFGMSNIIAVPLRSERSIVGCLVARGRVGAEDFDPSELRLVESLANELVLSLESRRLFDQVLEEQ